MFRVKICSSSGGQLY